MENYPDFLPLLLSKSDEREQKEIRHIKKIINVEDEIAMVKKEHTQPNENRSYNETLENIFMITKLRRRRFVFSMNRGMSIIWNIICDITRLIFACA